MPVVMLWSDVPGEAQKCIEARMGEDWDASAQHGGPLVVFHSGIIVEQSFPTEIVKRLDACHDGRMTLVFENGLITVWYHTVGITL